MSFNIPEKARVNYKIEKEKIGFDKGIVDDVQEIRWIGTLKPSIMNVEAVTTDDKRYEEIQILVVVINSIEHIYEIGRSIFKKIKYPVLLKMCYEDKYVLGVCQFRPGKIDSDENILSRIIYSHWLRDEYMSCNAEKLIEDISEALNREENLYNMYRLLKQSIMNYKLGGTSKAHVIRLLKHMLGTKVDFDEIMKKSNPVKYYRKIGGQFSRKKENHYIYVYDYEEIWYCFMKNKRVANVIQNRRYRDIEDLMLSIDERLEE